MTDTPQPVCIERSGFDQLLAVLKKSGYHLVGPTIQEGAIVYDDIDSAEDLPEGWTDDQDAGTYRLRRRADKALFGHNSGPHSWKKFLYPAKSKLWTAKRTKDGFVTEPGEKDAPVYAFVGVHACDIKAIRIQDKVFMAPGATDPRYGKRREAAFILAVNCGQSSKTCFCVSMGSGPRVEDGFDLALTEIIKGGQHYFVAEAGSERGAAVLKDVKSRKAEAADLAAVAAAVEKAKSEQVRSIDTDGIKEMMYRNYGSSHWEKVAERCMSCANCTLVCPTCFCSKSEDEVALTGDIAERWRYWDSCFTLDFSYIHGGTIRQSTGSRYRQWITHKLASWYDQFGTSGCVGCGRCIAWCPVGIDITQEVRALKDSEGGKANG